ncbi:hypothetical protein [Streptomyces sp. NPDC002602]|uniref:hypothetical protein n=1 Tax=Streptomyces sp. NPDC002602 TaxID=3364654 RepID=UPI00368A4463
MALVSAAAVAATLGGASSASATSVIGFGNGAHDNACRNTGGSLAEAATTRVAGIVAGLAAAVPMSGPANQCGNLGLGSMVSEVEDVNQNNAAGEGNSDSQY